MDYQVVTTVKEWAQLTKKGTIVFLQEEIDRLNMVPRSPEIAPVILAIKKACPEIVLVGVYDERDTNRGRS